MSELLKPVEWVGSSLEDLKEFPEEVRQVLVMRYIWLNVVKSTRLRNHSKALRGLGCLKLSKILTETLIEPFTL
ncbi:conserved hypothetical protein [Limnospira maxima CS-328]|uniref:Uncharacterized protein n=1 Tax=Limnospira maxima CS-328 TaxID=513049 RepID=B5VZK6_LIMMA|nr:conserved hypothetical protein [Limnospira maxima CS-328]